MNTLLLERESLRAPLSRALVSPFAAREQRHRQSPNALGFGEFRTVVRSNAACWEGYERVPGTAEGTKGSCRKKGEKHEAAESDSESEDYKKKKQKKETHDEASKKGIHPKGSDADGDGVTGEGKEKKDWKGDDDGDGVPNAIDKDKKKKHSNASKEECDCGCKETHEASAGSVDKDKHKEGKIFKLPKGHSKEYGES